MAGFRMCAALVALAPSLRSQEPAMPQQGEVMPMPAHLVFKPGRLAVTESFTVVLRGQGDERLAPAVGRLLHRWERRMEISFSKSTRMGTRMGTGSVQLGPEGTGSNQLLIECAEAGNANPSLRDDESYTLEVTAARATLQAATTVGAIWGLETLEQLPARDAHGWYVPGVSIRDEPRFPWRGLMIDVARHWQPPEVIRRNLDCMALVKLNVLHMHLTDDQGFRIESRTHPELSAKGSDGDFFTQAQMRDIIEYARARGIRVVPEFDIPGHTTSWLVSHPELASLPGPYSIERHWGIFKPVLDPTNEAVYRLLDEFLGEMSTLFPDPFVHIGGDENNGVQWNANPGVQAFILARGLKGNEGLQAYFSTRVAAILARHGKRMVGWDEILAPGVPGDAVIHSWRGVESLAAAARLGHDCLLSNGYYINLMYSARDHYLNDPLPVATPLTALERKRILGGEATMWSEWATPETIDSVVWPRTAAIAERLWSPREVADVADMYRRLDAVGARLEEAGSMHAKGQEAMAERLAGGAPTAVAALQSFLEAIEPVKGYERGALQPWSVQSTPLVGVPDCVLPESRASWIFSNEVERYLANPGSAGSPGAAALLRKLDSWRDAGVFVADMLSPRSAALRDAAPLARALADAARVGRAALESLEGGRVMDTVWLKEQDDVLDRCAKPVSAAELPMIAALRKLAAAAAQAPSGPKAQ